MPVVSETTEGVGKAGQCCKRGLALAAYGKKFQILGCDIR